VPDALIGLLVLSKEWNLINVNLQSNRNDENMNAYVSFGSTSAVFDSLKTLLLYPRITDIENVFSDFSEITSAIHSFTDLIPPI
jgi:hypothetical protein